jgi:hypothetical protein
VTGTAPLRPPAGRYGPEPTARTRRWRVVGLVALVAAVIGALAWVGGGVLRDPVQWRDVGYDVVDDTSIEVTFDVTKDPAASATCRVEALSKSYAQVGVADVAVGPSSSAQRTQRVTVDVPTAERAVTGVVKECTLDE